MKYCDDANCPKFSGGECKLGFILRFRTPKSLSETVYHDWGYVMPKQCRNRLKPKRITKLYSQQEVMPPYEIL